MFKKLYPFMIGVAGLGLAFIVYDVYRAMWATDVATVVCLGIVMATYWVSMILDYLDARAWKKFLIIDKK